MNQLIQYFNSDGWKVRKSEFSEYLITNDWAELEISETDEELLLSGIIDESKFMQLAKSFKELSLIFKLELYNSEMVLIREEKNGHFD